MNFLAYKCKINNFHKIYIKNCYKNSVNENSYNNSMKLKLFWHYVHNGRYVNNSECVNNSEYVN